MAQQNGVYLRPDSRCWWINATLQNGKSVRENSWIESREAEAYLAE